MKSDFFIQALSKDDLAAAPLAGVSFLPFRKILRKFFKGLIYSEMISAEGVSRRNAESLEYLEREKDESPLAFQLFGGRPEAFAEAAKIAGDICEIDAFDINMGCPVKKVLKSGGGCALLSDLPQLKETVKAMRKATDLPFSIKIRTGLNNEKPVYNEVIDIAQSEGADAIIIHARSKADMFGGTVRLDILEEAAAKSAIPVIGNGGVASPETYNAMKKTGVAGVMIGRAMMKSPWIFSSIRKGVSSENYLTRYQIGELLRELREYMLLHAGKRDNKKGHYAHLLRKFAVWFCRGMEGASEFRVKIYQTQDKKEIDALIDDFFSFEGVGSQPASRLYHPFS